MKIKVYPSELAGKITAPPSKSVAHRAIIAASIARGTSYITNVAYSDDILATIDACKQLGARIRVLKDRLKVTGFDLDAYIMCRPHLYCEHRKEKFTAPITVNARESGSTFRFLLPIFALLDREVKFIGSKRLLERPLAVYEKIFAEQKLHFTRTSECVEVNGMLEPVLGSIPGDISSQFITGLMYALSLAEGHSLLNVTGKFESKSYVDLTVGILKKFRVKVEYWGNNTFHMPGPQQFCATDYEIEGDYSNAAFFLAQNDITGDDKITVTGLNPKSKQGDRQIVRLVKNKKHKIDLSDIPDLGPILATRAAFKKGKTVIFNAKRLRIKESDRIFAIETELKKCGVNISSTDDEITVYGIKKGEKYTATSELYSHNDHRIAMSLCIAALNFDTPTVINGVESINKSYPNFLCDLESLGAKIERLEE